MLGKIAKPTHYKLFQSSDLIKSFGTLKVTIYYFADIERFFEQKFCYENRAKAKSFLVNLAD